MSLVVEQCRQNLMSLYIKDQQLVNYLLPECPADLDRSCYDNCIEQAVRLLDEYRILSDQYSQEKEAIELGLKIPTAQLLNEANALQEKWQQSYLEAEAKLQEYLAPIRQVSGQDSFIDSLVQEFLSQQEQDYYQEKMPQYASDLQMNDRWVLVFRHGAMVEIVEEEYEGATDIAALWDTGIGLLKKTQRIDAIYHQEDIDQGSIYYATCQPERSVTYTLILPASLIEKLEQNQLPVEALAERLQQQEQAIPWFIIDPEENIFYS